MAFEDTLAEYEAAVAGRDSICMHLTVHAY